MSIESKSILAKLLATENLIVEQRNVRTAMFDTVNRVLTVPILDKNIPSETYDLFMGHEVGHALYTPQRHFEIDKKNGVNRGLSNIIEDARIEKMIKMRYPGLRNSFLKGYRDLLDRNFFEIKDRDVNEMSFVDRINLHFKCGVLLNVEFDKDESKIIKKIEKLETYDEIGRVHV